MQTIRKRGGFQAIFLSRIYFLLLFIIIFIIYNYQIANHFLRGGGQSPPLAQARRALVSHSLPPQFTHVLDIFFKFLKFLFFLEIY